MSSGTHHGESRHLAPAAPSVVGRLIAERCSAARVRFAAANAAAPLPPPRRSAWQRFATDGSAGNQMQRSFFVLQRREPGCSRQNIMGD
jgi:hypothetical protein